jgi:hypothetical protein
MQRDDIAKTLKLLSALLGADRPRAPCCSGVANMMQTVLAIIGAAFLLLSILPYLIWHFYVSFSPPQDLKKRYKATWALVTGASSGKRHMSLQEMPTVTTQAACGPP